ncbi:MAG: aldehyde dehydrogenase family protein, partial [Flavobacteriaceae bacterium]|nr:aldehyde dehydrogenase family protein [Flavobacteriaceae bacterium]
IYSEPYGTVLIISPWNYPFQLALLPLISAIAAGNTAVIKPSEHAPNTSTLLEKIISSVFNENYVKVIQGDYKTSAHLLEFKWDYIFFTGSVKVGKIVAKAASNNITPVTLELGGKNPCIIDKSIDLKLAARRIVWGKFVNAGQTCIAPDYILINKQIKLPFVYALINEIENAYGKDQFLSSDYPRIINKSNTDRLISLIKNQKILYGGLYNKQENYLSPTLIDSPKLDSNLMNDEIFGPILPVIEYDNEAKIYEIISEFEKPLALYVFTTNTKFSDNIINKVSFGGGVINDTMIHFGNHRLPFGGVGQSGIGSYHGKSGFDLFSHFKPIVKKGNWLDIKTRYAPYNGKLSSLKRLLRLLN